MRHLRALLLRFAGLFHKGQQSGEFAEEIESHLLAHIEDNLRLGMNAGEARRQALIKLGGMQQVKATFVLRRERCARTWGSQRSPWRLWPSELAATRPSFRW